MRSDATTIRAGGWLQLLVFVLAYDNRAISESLKVLSPVDLDNCIEGRLQLSMSMTRSARRMSYLYHHCTWISELVKQFNLFKKLLIEG